MGYIREIYQFYDFSEKYFIKNLYSAASWGALASKIESGAKFRTFWHMEGSVAHNLGGVSSLFRPSLTSCVMCRDHILKNNARARLAGKWPKQLSRSSKIRCTDRFDRERQRDSLFVLRGAEKKSDYDSGPRKLREKKKEVQLQMCKRYWKWCHHLDQASTI